MDAVDAEPKRKRASKIHGGMADPSAQGSHPLVGRAQKEKCKQRHELNPAAPSIQYKRLLLMLRPPPEKPARVAEQGGDGRFGPASSWGESTRPQRRDRPIAAFGEKSHYSE
jgi:hypothetical protein